MSIRVCTCIRHERDARQVAVPDPTCPHGTVQADRDARHTANALGRLLRWTARAYLLAVLPWIYATHTPDMTAWHWLAAAIATPLALIAMPTPKERP